jgi:hypothetical protein
LRRPYGRFPHPLPQDALRYALAHALISAGRFCLKSLNRPSDALRFYQAAKASRIPHLDWDANIDSGIQQAQAALGQAPATAPVGTKAH